MAQKTRRARRKLHLGIDAETGQIVASVLTSKEIDDGVAVSPSLDQLSGSLSSFTADGAYDQDGIYAVGANRRPEAAVIVSPRRTAVLSDMVAIAPTQCDRNPKRIAEKDRMAWQQGPGYSRRAKVETAIGRWKQVVGNGLRSHTDDHRTTEVEAAVSMSSIACWRSDVRTMSALSDRHTGAGWGRCAQAPDPCTMLTFGTTFAPTNYQPVSGAPTLKS
ncbi:transposase [Acidisphaera sp. S103]|uniref:transposase n=1 Tax=Acidisphaera sp. S103 TaxID=1747223 RepID=UPI00131D0C20|nr:transposase [Acidisphaera sp. S103]